MDKNRIHKDAGEGAFFQRELELSKPLMYQVVYPNMVHDVALPLSPDKDPAATQIVYKMFDVLGTAKIVSNYADDLPRADALGKEFFLKVHTLGVACGWDIYELRAGAKTGRPIDRTKLSAAREVIMRLVEKLTFLGDSTVGIVGFTGITSMPNTVVPTFSAAVTWAAKIALGNTGKNAILDDMNLALTRMATTTKGAEVPNACAIAPSSYAQIAQTPRTDNNDTTILDFFKKAHPEIEFILCPYLESSGTGGAKQMIFYRRDPSKIELEIPEDVFVHPEQMKNLEYVVPVTARFAGVRCPYPLSLDSSYGM